MILWCACAIISWGLVKFKGQFFFSCALIISLVTRCEIALVVASETRHINLVVELLGRDID